MPAIDLFWVDCPAIAQTNNVHSTGRIKMFLYNVNIYQALF